MVRTRHLRFGVESCLNGVAVEDYDGTRVPLWLLQNCFATWLIQLGGMHSGDAALFNAGWVRMGPRLSKPLNSRACCPNYAIRLDINAFTPSKSQLKLLEKRAPLLVGAPCPAAVEGECS